MNEVRRDGVFETNSSSTHSISISPIDVISDKSLVPDENGVITIYGGEFGWEYETYHGAAAKASYCYADNYENSSRLEMLVRVITIVTGAKEVVFDPDPGYVDHQSCGTSNEAFESDEALSRFIFNHDSWVETGNDNG